MTIASWRGGGLLCACLLGLGACEEPIEGPFDLAPGHDLAAAQPDLGPAPDLSMPDLGPEPDMAMSLGDMAVGPDLSFACTPNAFRACDGQMARYCNGTGDGEVAIDCGAAGCLGPQSCGQCVPNNASCTGSTLEACDPYGRSTTSSCALGCAMTAADADAGTPSTAHCRTVVPSNGFALDCVARSATFDLDVQADTEIDPDSGTIGGAAAPAGVFDATTHAFHVRSLTVAAGKTLAGKPGAVKPVILLVDGDVQIDGTIDVAAHLDAGKTVATRGPGAPTPGTSFGQGGVGATASTTTSAGQGAGAGGGSYGSSGGKGGNASSLKGQAGSVFPIPPPDPVIISPLQGGGAGGNTLGSGRAQGGGAVQITACGTISVGSMMNPVGLVNAGGSGAPVSNASGFGGGLGGGAGGAILLEAPTISVYGLLAAAGGSGGGGDVAGTTAQHGGPGSDAPTDIICAAAGGLGASGNGSTGGVGGVGACGPNGATDGTMGTIGTDAVGHGGGGGGGGRIRLNALSNPTITPATSVSPNLAACYTTGTLALQ